MIHDGPWKLKDEKWSTRFGRWVGRGCDLGRYLGSTSVMYIDSMCMQARCTSGSIGMVVANSGIVQERIFLS